MYPAGTTRMRVCEDMGSTMACSWIVADTITENSTNVTENSTKVTENSTNVTGNSTKVAGTCHITAQQHQPPPDKRARDARVVAHPKRPRQGSLSCVFKAWVVWKVPHVQLCLYRATGLWHRGVGHGFGHGFGLGTGFFSLERRERESERVRIVFVAHEPCFFSLGHPPGVRGCTSRRGEREREREKARDALFLLHMNRVSLVWRFPGIAFVHLSSWEVVGSLT